VDSLSDGKFGIFLKVAELERVKATSHNYSGASFPMIDLDVKPDISWIKGLRIGVDYWVDQAIQQTKFRMNEFGARAQSAVGMTLRCKGAGPGPHVIDRPFLLWIQRDGMQFPLFAAVLCEDSWKEPAKL